MPHREGLLAGLTEAQREAVTTVSGPVAIVAGAGSGKTRVVSRRAAYAVATGAVEERRILLVTFTDRAAKEMAERLGPLGLHRVTARTFHSAALAQLRYFWPSRHDGRPLPEVMADRWRIVSPLARALPGGYRYTPARDLIDEIEWAKSRRLTPRTYEREAGGRTPPVPTNLFVRLFGEYERTKQRRGLLDFDDILTLTVELLEGDEDAARAVHGRYAWFCVDEFQDTTPLQSRLLDLWLGDRRDLCVVGDEDQTIYTFAGATPQHLLDFGARFPEARIIALLENHRSTPQVLRLANRLLASGGGSKRLIPTLGAGPEPTIRSYADDETEIESVVERVRELLAAGVAGREVAVLVRLNAQVAPFEAAFTRAGIRFHVRGQRFFDRRDVRAAVRAIEQRPLDLRGGELLDAVREAWLEQLGFDPDEVPVGREAQERHAALATLLGIVGDILEAPEGGDRAALLADLAQRAERDRQDDPDGVELLTLHRAKGLEWDAVFIPCLEEGLLPVGQATEDEAALAEERRLLYVGITRARRCLALSWSRQRRTATGRMASRTMSRFLRPLVGGASQPDTDRAAPRMPRVARRDRGAERGAPSATKESLDEADAGVFDALRAWRLDRMRQDEVPAYIVASDAVLAGIAVRRPRTEAELLEIPGIGPAKVSRYGREIIALLKEL